MDTIGVKAMQKRVAELVDLWLTDDYQLTTAGLKECGRFLRQQEVEEANGSRKQEPQVLSTSPPAIHPQPQAEPATIAPGRIFEGSIHSSSSAARHAATRLPECGPLTSGKLTTVESNSNSAQIPTKQPGQTRKLSLTAETLRCKLLESKIKALEKRRAEIEEEKCKRVGELNAALKAKERILVGLEDLIETQRRAMNEFRAPTQDGKPSQPLKRPASPRPISTTKRRKLRRPTALDMWEVPVSSQTRESLDISPAPTKAKWHAVRASGTIERPESTSQPVGQAKQMPGLLPSLSFWQPAGEASPRGAWHLCA